MHIAFLTDIFRSVADKEAVVGRDDVRSYGWLLDRMSFWEDELQADGIVPGAVVALEADFSPEAIALFLALIERSCIIVPLLTTLTERDREKKYDIAEVEFAYSVDEDDAARGRRLDRHATHEFFKLLRERKHPGLVLFTSGTSGEPKAAVHDFLGLLEKFKQRRPSLRTLNFLLFDHWGGLNTLLHTLSNGSLVITLRDRSPDAICAAICKYRIQILPASPTFLNLLLISEAYKRYDLSSLQIISYGTEPMPMSTLKRTKAIFPLVQLRQTYGLIELGVLRAKSKSDDSLWVKVGGEGYQTRVVDGVLQIKATSAMLGYLNASSPFTADGWFNTNDAVLEDGEYLKILGRKSEIINVGGEKVYPAEVESRILEMENIADVSVYGEENPIMGKIVCANVTLVHDEDRKELTHRVKRFCRQSLQEFKIPVKVKIVSEIQHGARFKKVRR